MVVKEGQQLQPQNKLNPAHSRIVKTLIADFQASEKALQEGIRFALNSAGFDHMKFGVASDMETIVPLPQVPGSQEAAPSEPAQEPVAEATTEVEPVTPPAVH